jgi:phosphomannomutase
MEKITYCFDVDGTLTLSRSPIDSTFHNEFLKFAQSNEVCLVTGSDYPKTLEQLGQEIINACNLIFNCCGNEIRSKDQIKYRSSWKADGLLYMALEYEKRRSAFPIRTGKHVEDRVGMINFSIVGRNATKEQRAQYVAGETGLDIYPKGKDKSQVREWIENKLVFFGDRCDQGGNDYPLAKVADVVYNVKNWEETRKIILNL